MLKLFTRPFRQPAPDLAGLGAAFIALPLAKGCTVPPGCFAVLADQQGHTRRLSEGARLLVVEGETAWCVHPGPYTCELTPFAAAPEIGLRVAFAFDAPDPREAHQRFDLFLASEGSARVALDGFVAALQLALQRELAQGNIELPPCTSFEEWNVFRSGFNQLLYTRFGVMVDDCIPVELGASNDLAALLSARLALQPAPQPAALPPQEAFDAAGEDARALRRLFLELPGVLCGLRLAVLPADCAIFRRHQELLRRLDLVSLAVGTMPALELAAPGQPLAGAEQLRRARHSRRAAAALDEAWALLARLKHLDAAQAGALLEEADRIVANLECDCAARRDIAGPPA
ncbi:hypothetical protein [Massilia yuzhufengensis]|uniref:Uncharacterized protein n=1 Tax=Massilia yuzhufengensis TaxID=1164594 RepID=A0A1I1PMY4_9BURK|nr:hypothetical protein [Massilia yuzhufengensis]SFD11082.1 hypothetical protein SAMN05216204_11672 [Massilia yuzhufengensis]